MGIVISRRELRSVDKGRFLKPIIYCNPEKELIDNAISLNVLLAEKLVGIKPKRRAMRMEQCVQQVLSVLPENTVIKDFDVMFNPEYKIDVLHILVAQCRVKPFDVLWPGRCEDEKLIYAEEGFRDYRVFEINKYDVTCVV